LKIEFEHHFNMRQEKRRKLVDENKYLALRLTRMIYHCSQKETILHKLCLWDDRDGREQERKDRVKM